MTTRNELIAQLRQIMAKQTKFSQEISQLAYECGYKCAVSDMFDALQLLSMPEHGTLNND